MTKELGTEDFDREIAGQSTLVLVDFYTDGCVPCRMLTPILNEIALEDPDRLKIIKIDAAANVKLAARYRVSAVPTLLLFKGGQVLGQILGLKSKKDLLTWIDSMAQ